jgi:hypothetical protein
MCRTVLWINQQEDEAEIRSRNDFTFTFCCVVEIIYGGMLYRRINDTYIICMGEIKLHMVDKYFVARGHLRDDRKFKKKIIIQQFSHVSFSHHF